MIQFKSKFTLLHNQDDPFAYSFGGTNGAEQKINECYAFDILNQKDTFLGKMNNRR